MTETGLRSATTDRTGAPWRDLPEGFGNWNSIFRQFRRWADSGVWDVILEGLAGSDSGYDKEFDWLRDEEVFAAPNAA